MQPVVERQEYALGTVCAAIPITAGIHAPRRWPFPCPLHQEDRLLPAVEQLRSEIGGLLGLTRVLYQYLKNHSL